MDTLLGFSRIMLYTAFILYLVATVFFGGTIKDKKNGQNKKGIAGKIGITITLIGFAAQVLFTITRWIASGHAPVSNLFEFMTFFGMSLVLAFIILYFIYRVGVLGLFALPIAMILIAFASMFPTEISPLQPSLQSNWLYIHITTVSFGNAILSISFVTGLIYLIRQINQSARSKRTTWLEVILFSLFIFIGFSVITVIFNALDYSVEFESPGENEPEVTEYQLPAIVGPYKGELATEGKMDALVEMPEWLDAKKFNTFIWSVLTALIIYGLFRVIFRKRVGAAIQPYLQKTNPDLLDEITFRAVAIGFPVFTLGGLVFAAIWAQQAWDRFWGWDPKEVWALVTFLFYTAFLHLRLSRGWHGEKSAWLTVVGFAIIMFNLVAVNLILVGLHSYA